MCLICVEYEKNKLLPAEALRNLEEMESAITKEHFEEVHDKIMDDFLQLQLDEYWEITGFGD